MMVIRCENCGKQYRIEETTIHGPSVRSRCKECQHVIVVTKPEVKPPATSKSETAGQTAPSSGDLSARQPSDPGVAPSPASDEPTDREPGDKGVGQQAPAPPDTKRNERDGALGSLRG
jgi:predicted Zn finger-like uncharacterized protein